MPELRKDPIIERWVIIATERQKRPSDFTKDVKSFRIVDTVWQFSVTQATRMPVRWQTRTPSHRRCHRLPVESRGPDV